MITRPKRLAVVVCGATFVSSLTLATAQPYIYPNQGQSPQQEQSDKGQCYSWAVQQSGFDPANPQVPMAPPAQSPIGSVARLNGQLILQGVQGAHGWTLIIAQDTGQMSATIVGAVAGYVIFGSCTQLSQGGVQGQ